MPADPDHYSMSFGDHLEELRRRILMAIIVPLPLMVIAFVFTDPIIEWLYKPLDRVLETMDLPRGLQALGPAEFLGMKLKLSIIGAIVVSVPWIFWQGWLFVRPGLYRHERRFVHLLVPGSAVLTAAGVTLLYYAMLPLMLQVLVHFGTSIPLPEPEAMKDTRVREILESDPPVQLRFTPPEAPEIGDVWILWPQQDIHVAVEPPPPEENEQANPAQPVGPEVLRLPRPPGGLVSQEFRLTTYINFVLILMLGMVVAFQMPLVVLLAGWLGLLTPTVLRRRRKHALLICALVAAVITPADAVSMVLMLIPLYGLYELSIVLLIIAPASKVAEGRLWGRSHPSDNAGALSVGPSSQTDRADRKDDPPSQPLDQPSDDEGDGR
jgi:sec-independent protein translocase protein TatC